MQVVNIRGTTSSGKTTLMKQIIESAGESAFITLTKDVRGTLLPRIDAIVIGVSKPGSKFGGCDAIAKVEYMEQAIWKALSIMPTVLFEGLLVSHSFGRWLDFSVKLELLQKKYTGARKGMIWAFINPTFRQNLKQLKKRNNLTDLREARGDEFIMNFVSRYKSIVRLEKKVVLAKQTIIYPLQDPYPADFVTEYIADIRDPVLLPLEKKGGIAKFLR